MNQHNFHSSPINLLIQSQRPKHGTFGFPFLVYVLFSLGLVITLSFNWVSVGSAQGTTGFIREVRSIETNELDIHNPVGLAFSPQGNVFYVLEAHSTSQSSIITMSPFEDLIDTSIVNTSFIDPINVAYNSLDNSLLLLDSGANEIIKVNAGADGILDTNPDAIIRYKINQLGLQDPQGMTVDPVDGHLLILDNAAQEIVRIDPDTFNIGNNQQLSFNDRVSRLDLSQTGLVDPRGLAMNPTNGHLFVYSPTEKVVYEITWTGQVVSTFDISLFEIKDPQSLVFALSGDMTDDPDTWNLYIADSGIDALDSRAQIMSLSDQTEAASSTEAAFKIYLPMTVSTPIKKYNPQLALGRVVELSFSPTAPITLATNFTSIVIQTIDTANYNPPSPDPSGIAFVPTTDRLAMVDGEVEETVGGKTHFAGVNYWETTRGGSVVYTGNISKEPPTDTPMSDEPTGIAWNPNNGHYYITDDNAKEVFDLDPGGDNLVGTSDDTWTRFDTQTHGSSDPEGIAYDTINNRIFVADGANNEIYEYSVSGTLLNQFDVLTYGIQDPEAVEFNPADGTLFVMSSRRVVALVVEVTTSGSLIQTIDFSDAAADTPAGLAYAPASNGSGAMRFYIVDRAVDNNSDPNAVDGLMYEMTAPGSSNVDPVANPDNAITNINTPINIDVADNDSDANGNLDPASTNTSCPSCSVTSNGNLVNEGDGTFTYTPDNNFIGDDSFKYEICDTDNACDTAIVDISVTPTNDPPIANDDPSESTNEDTPVTINVWSNDSDPDNNLDPNSANTTCATCTLPANGTLQNNGDGTFDYSPNLNFNGSDGFIYEICDSFNLCDTATVTINVDPTDDPPTAINDDAITVETTPVTIDVAFNDDDPDGDLDPTSANTTCPTCSGPSSGSLNNHNDGTFTYTANNGFTGVDNFDYEICDSGSPSLCDTASVNVVVSEQLFIETMYLSSNSSGTVGSVSFKDEDILAFDFATGTYSMFFDGSDVGLGASGVELDGFHLNPDGTILLTVEPSSTLPDVGTVGDTDIVRFTPTSTGDVTAGTYEMYFDGSDVELSDDSGEDIDAVGIAADGSLIISTRGNYSVGTISGNDIDLLKFTPTSMGDTTSGTWELYFDGTDVGLEDDRSNEDLNALWINFNDDIYLSSRTLYSVPGAAGDSADIYTCVPSSLGDLTACTFSIFWDGSANGFAGENLNGMTLNTTGGPPSDTDPPTLVNNTGSTVSEGGTDPIPNTELQYSDAQPAANISYSVTVAPTNGLLDLTGGPPGPISSFTQADIDSGLLVYVHDGSNTTSDSFSFDVDDSLGNVLTSQAFAITVTPVDNEAPTLVNNTGSTVLEGGTDPIPNTELQYADAQPISSISFTVTGGPTNGQLELTSASGTSIGSFTQADIDSGLLVYVHDGTNTTTDSFSFDVDDSLTNVLASQSFAITITPVDDEAPTMVNNTGSTVLEGGTDPIPNTELRYDDAVQPASSVIFTVTTPPANGLLDLTGGPPGPISSFTQADIDGGSLVYVHDDSNTTSDSFGFSVDDGLGNVLAGQSFAITVTPVDDDPPALVNNTGSTVIEGGTDPIPNTELRYDDAVQPASSVSYTVTSSPVNGQLELTSAPGTAITSFTQAVIDSGSLVYAHDGTNTTSDSFGFSVDDGLGNVLGGQSFAITIIAADNDAPTMVNNTGSTVLEGGTDPIPNTELQYADAQPTSSISFTVTGGPTNGQLELTSASGNSISSFTQADIDSGLLVYVHDGSNTTSDSFSFDVDDSLTNILAGQSFAITITPVDDEAPTLVNNTGSTVSEGGTDPIPNTELRYDDAVQPASSVIFTVTTPPANGLLDLTGGPPGPISTFTQADIDGGSLVYVHDGSNTTSDSFGFSVDDGLGNVLTGQSFSITVTPVDDDPPALVNNTGSTVIEGGTDPIPNTELRYDDAVQPASSVSYTVTSSPVNGQLELSSAPGTPISSFTQAVIDSGSLVYAHDGTNTTSDSFGFSVDDGLGNVLAGQSFAITVSPVDDEAPTLVNNTGSTVLTGGTDPIPNTELRFDDVQPASSVSYAVSSGPTNGQLELTSGSGTPVSSFTQADIDGGLLVYVHDGSGSTSDSFGFDVGDGLGNVLAGQSFSITISNQVPATTLYVSSTSSGNVGGVDFKDEDILAFDLDTNTWSMFLDGSVVGLEDAGSVDIDAFHVNQDGSILLSFTSPETIPDVGSIDDSDIVRFIPISSGDYSSGTYEWYFDGSDVGLSTNGEDVDAIGFAPDGRLVVGTSGSFSVTGLSGLDEDLIMFNASSFGVTTSGTWEMYFDGSDVNLDTSSSEDVVGTWIDSNGDIYLAVKGNFTVTGLSGDADDVFNCESPITGDATSCTSFNLYWDGDLQGYGGEIIAGFGFDGETIGQANSTPTVSISSPTNSSSFDEGDNITFTGTASDVEDGNLTTSISWLSSLDGPIGNGGSFSRTDLSIGAHIITASVTDSGGKNGEDTVTITVLSAGSVVMVGAGDIASCDVNVFEDELTAQLIDNIPGTVFTLGDNVYESGTVQEFNDCYDPTWGRHKARTFPTVGNHEYFTPGATPYYNYFGAAAGDPTKGYYSYNLGNWHIVVMNSNCGEIGGCGANDPQGQWLSADLAANPTMCTLAYTHLPRFSSGKSTQPTPSMEDFTQILYNAGVDIMMGGDDHIYQRFALQNPFAVADPQHGIRQFVVGTGGKSHGTLNSNPPNSEVLNTTTFGVLKLILEPTSYTWEFVPIAGETFTDSGTANCVTPAAGDITPPAPVNNTGSSLLEGGTDPIPNTELEYTDAQPATSINFSITSGPTNGQLELTSSPGTSISSFTQADINGGLLVYVHNDSNTTSDLFGFNVDDSQGNVLSGQSFAFTITPVDDDPPAQVNNTGSTVLEGGTDPIPTAELRYDDAVPPGSVNFTITGSPVNGQLELTSNSGVPISSFTQADVDGGLLVYIHDGSSTASDSYGFSVDDGLGNVLTGQSFAITIIASDNDPPTLVNNTGSSVVKGSSDSITNSELQFADAQPTSSINFSVTSNPVNGQLELTSSPGISISSFTQADINSGLLVYVHDDSSTTSDNFGFDVDDGLGNVLPGQSFAFTITTQQALNTLYLSSTSGGTAGGVAFKDEDILVHDIDTGTWSMYFDGSDVGLEVSGQEIDGLHLNSDGSILLSLGATGTIPDVGAVDDFDIIRFIPTSLGDATAGTYELYFDGEDVGLSGEDIDALTFAPDGRIVISPRGSFNLGSFSGDDEDLIAFTATSLGATTSGTWEMYFDGSDVGLDTASSEDVNAIWIDSNGDIYVSARGAYAVTGLTGDGDDIIICVPGSLGDTTSCTFSQFMDGSTYGFGNEVINGLHIGQ